MLLRPTSPHARLFTDLLRPHRVRLAALAVVLTLASTAPLAGPPLLAAFVDRAVDGAPRSLLLAIAGAYVAVGLVAQVMTVATTYAANGLAWSATNDLRERATAHALSLDLAYHGRTSPGALVERVDGDASAITTLFTDVVLQLVGGALTLGGALVLVSLVDWRVGAAMTVFVAVTLAVAARLRDRAVEPTAAERAAYAEVLGVVEEQLTASDDLRALGAGGFAADRHEAVSAVQLRANVRAWRASGELWAATTGAFALGGVLVLGAGWLLHRRGAISLGTVFLLFQYVQVLRRPLEVLTEQLEKVQEAAAGAVRMSRLLAERPGVRFDGRARLPGGALPVALDGVSFAYAEPGVTGAQAPGLDGLPVLDDVTLSVPAGGVVGLVGRTGSGKTTLARLALRLVDPTAGTVRLGGVDLRTVSAESLRDRVAVVTQDVQLFAASLRDNLTLFTDGWSDAALRGLLTDLGLGAVVADLPAGLDTRVAVGDDDDPGAVGLSAGQAQLVGIARAFLRDPGLVVLDEASSRVDPVTADLVEAALDRLLAGRTALVIAHRLSAVDRADEVLVLDGGRVVERGSPPALAADPASRFARMRALDRAVAGGRDEEEVSA